MSSAPLRVSPVTSGTVRVVGALATVSVTTDPLGAAVLAWGDWPITVPRAEPLDGCVTACTLSPLETSTGRAAESCSPITDGTRIGAGPRLT